MKWNRCERKLSTLLQNCSMNLHRLHLYMELRTFPMIFASWISHRRDQNFPTGIFVCGARREMISLIQLIVMYSTIRFAKCFSIIVWGGVITIAFLLSILMTIWIWQRSQNTPTLTTIDTYYYPIWNVPFPAVTFCNINVVYRPAMEQLMRKL